MQSCYNSITYIYVHVKGTPPRQLHTFMYTLKVHPSLLKTIVE